MGGHAVDGVANDPLPFGHDTLVLRLVWPLALPKQRAGRMWRMRGPAGPGAGHEMRDDDRSGA